MLSFSQSSPSYDIVCPGDKLVFTCITSYGEGGGIVWRISTTSRTQLYNWSLFIYGFVLNITEVNNTKSTVTSTATNESIPLQLNGTVISCSGNGFSYSNTLTVRIAGKIHHEPYVS